jgi:hypothetical protein
MGNQKFDEFWGEELECEGAAPCHALGSLPFRSLDLKCARYPPALFWENPNGPNQICSR